jgi:hypothetical protein
MAETCRIFPMYTIHSLEQNGKTSLRRPKLLTKEVKRLMKKKKRIHDVGRVFTFNS